MNQFPGEITASYVDIRFAYSGRVAKVQKVPGDRVKKGDIIASLDRSMLQMELDKQLSDYEKTRADFELFSLKNGKGPDSNDVIKYMRQIQQAELNASVKDIELAKARMDQADIISPVNGIITDMQGMAPGINITPASNPVTILDLNSLVFAAQIPQAELFQFSQERQMKMTFPGVEKSYIGKQKLPTFGKKGMFTLPITLEDTEGLYPGMSGEATFKLD